MTDAPRLGRPLVRLAVALTLALALALGALVVAAWWAARDDVAWSTSLPGGPYRVLDWDDSRVLVASPSRVVLLDREDGSVVRSIRAEVDDQGWLRPDGGFLTLSRGTTVLQAWEGQQTRADEPHGALPEPTWQLEGSAEQGLRMMATTDEVVVVHDGAAGELRALDLDDGSTAWTTGVEALVPMLDSGQMLDQVQVVGALLPGQRRGSLLSVDDGEPVADLPLIGVAESMHVWGDRAVVAAGPFLWVVSPEATVELDPPWDVARLPALPQAGGVVTATGAEGAWGIDLDGATISPLPPTDEPDDYEAAYQVHQVDDRTTVVDVDGELTGVDRGTGQELFTLGGTGVALAQGRAATLVQRSPAGADGWLERLATWRADAGVEVQVVDRDGTTHSSLVTDADELGDRAVLDGHEALVVLQGDDFAIQQSQVVLLGR